MIPLQEFNNLLAKFGWLFALVMAVILVIVIVIIILVNRNHKKPKNIAIYDYLGGKSNVLEAEIKGSRLILKLENPSEIKEDDLHILGVKSIISMNNKTILVLSPKLKKSIEKSF